MAQAVPHIQADWDERVFVNTITLNLRKITDFLNKFELSTRYRLAKVNERLTILERQVVFLESMVNTTQSAS